MGHTTSFNSVFENAFVKEIHHFEEVKYFKEGDIIMDYTKNIRIVALITKGTVKVYRLDENGNEILLYYLSGNESRSMTCITFTGTGEAFKKLNSKKKFYWKICLSKYFPFPLLENILYLIFSIGYRSEK